MVFAESTVAASPNLHATYEHRNGEREWVLPVT